MVAGGRNVRMNRQQMESRRKKQQIRWKSLLVRVAVLVVIVFCIRNIYARLEEMQMELERLEIQQYGRVQTSADAQPPDKLNDVDYIGSIDTWEVGKPIERTEAEVLQRLGELGQASSLIEGIYQNHSQYPGELLHPKESRNFHCSSNGTGAGGMSPMGVAALGWQAAVQRVCLWYCSI